MGDVIDLQAARERRKKRPAAHRRLLADPRSFMFGVGGYFDLMSRCRDGIHFFLAGPGYCECGKEYIDGGRPELGVFGNTSPDTSGGNIC